jgi:tetratricopeptide (TPR) repeat protein
MEKASSPRRSYPALILALVGTAFAILAAADKLFGLVQHPFGLASIAYVSLFSLLLWAFARGIPLKASRVLRLSGYAAFLLFNVLTAAYVFAWRLSQDPTPLLLRRHLDAQLAQGDELLRDGQALKAQDVYQEAYKRFPNSFPVLWRMGAVNYQLLLYDRARKFFSRALEVAPPGSRWRALNDLGQTYWKLGQPEEAIRLYEQAKQEGMPASELIEWHYRLGWAHFDLKQYDEAIEHYQAVAEAGEKYSAASYYNIACAEAQKLAAVKDPAERQALVQDAVDNLRQAWKATTSPEEIKALRSGLLGGARERDPDLQPLQKTPEYAGLIRELRTE